MAHTRNLIFIEADWPAPSNVRAVATTRIGGASASPFDSFNLALHVGDDASAVQQNRALLREELNLHNEPYWLNQVHSTLVITTDEVPTSTHADGCIARSPNQVCAVLTGDCLPVLICNRNGTEVAAIHAGWRGCLDGILHNAVQQMHSAPNELLVWLGPAISIEAYEVGAEVYQAYIDRNPQYHLGFIPVSGEKYRADLVKLASITLASLGVTAIYGGKHCTAKDNKLFYSYRREGGKTGRIANLIWLAHN
ncbi:MAG: peptidoglycan editing factor PgeF [Pseudomonadota bacterium]|nr:peptidoglycan editing factor PgeF [Pseudomonadota bacterium]